MKDGQNKGKLSWRDGLKVVGVGGGALFFGELADLMFFRGFVTSHLLRAKNDPDYRNRLISTIKQGRLDDKLKMEVQERIRPYNEICGLGDTLAFSEPALDAGFKEGYQVRKFITGGEETDNLLLVANIGSNVRVYKTEQNEKGCNSLSKTMKKHGLCMTIPSSYVSTRKNGDKYEFTLDSYCSYNQDGRIETYGTEKIDYASGAVVLFDNGRMRVVDRADILNYNVGNDNVSGIQSYGIAINSETLEKDLDSLEWTMYNTGGSAARSRDQTSFMLTLSDSEDSMREETILLSLYQHYDENAKEFSGNEWQLGLSIEQTVGICEQLALEREFDKFVLVGPDPNRFHSKVNCPVSLNKSADNQDWLRRFDYWNQPFFPESEVGEFAPPVFLGLEL